MTDRITKRRAGYMKIVIEREDPPESGSVFLFDEDDDRRRVPRHHPAHEIPAQGE